MNPTGPRGVPRFLLIIAVVVALAAGWLMGRTGPGDPPASGDTAEVSGEATIWTCSMHPQIRMPAPGSCPLCGMDLIPLETGGGDDPGPRSLTLSESARAIAEIRTAPVERREVEAAVRLTGKLEADESRVRKISAWVSGRIDDLYVDYTGVEVRRGQKLFRIYSPEVYSAQEELLQAVRAADAVRESPLASSRDSAERTVEAARERLRLWGVTDRQIRDAEERGTASEHVTIVSPLAGTVLHKNATEGMYVQTGQPVYVIADLSTLWLQLDAYESDLPWLSSGRAVRFTTDAFPGESFEGTVAFVDPVLDAATRAVRVRVDVPNADGRLKPGLFAHAELSAELAAGLSGAAEGASGPLVIPKTAPLRTGERAVVYVAHPERAGEFEGREVVLGPQAGDFIVVREGLSEGERVVTNGAFKIDSALQIQAKASMMNPAGGGPPPGHHHGDAPTGDPGAPAEEVLPDLKLVEPVAGVPDEFRRQMEALLAAYFDVGEALSLDDAATAGEAASRIPAAADRPAHALLPPAGHAPWGDLQTRLKSAADDIRAAADLEAAREAFFPLSRAMEEAVRRFGGSGSTPVLVYHCPMARDHTGGDWLQRKAGTENPYWGSKMFRCGSETEVLVAGPGAGEAVDAADPQAGHAH